MINTFKAAYVEDLFVQAQVGLLWIIKSYRLLRMINNHHN